MLFELFPKIIKVGYKYINGNESFAIAAGSHPDNTDVLFASSIWPSLV